MMSNQTAPAQTDGSKRERVVKAAVEWVFDQSCSNALAELEDAVCAFMGIDLEQARRPKQ
ncbi:hypothetical protein [Bradyrhizobium denitrificans]|uniref:hypothetical protein n=1 Tax=Bradyrhizobium denitrificans TaxID=2734912 RepID=UPI001AEDF709|nr:hypothetical protein [Bradyrhizobium sp. LMG 8443]